MQRLPSGYVMQLKLCYTFIQLVVQVIPMELLFALFYYYLLLDQQEPLSAWAEPNNPKIETDIGEYL